MKKTLLVVACVLALALPSFARVDINLWGGYTTVNMAKVNEIINDGYDSMPDSSGTFSKNKTNLMNGFIVGLDAGFVLIKGLSIGPRIEYLSAGGEVKAAETSMDLEMKMGLTGSLLPILGGVTYVLSLSDALSIGAGVYCGYGIAFSSMTTEMTNGSDTTTETGEYGGGSFAADGSLDAIYNISNAINIGLKLGYRLASVPEMKATKDNADMGLTKGDVAEDSDGNPMVFDYSGFIASINFGLVF